MDNLTRPNKTAIIVGAGISGLACAYRLRQAGWKVSILESTGETGGRIRNVELNQCIIDSGASLIPSRYRQLLALCDELGLTEKLVPAGSLVGFPRGGQLHTLDSSSLIADGLRSRLFKPASKLRLLNLAVDAMRIFPTLTFDSIHRASRFDCETASHYAQRKLNPELEEFFVGTTVRGMFGHDPEQASVIDFFWGMRNFLGGKLFGLRGGMQGIVDALAKGSDVHFHSRVLLMEEDEGGASVEYLDAEGKSQHLSADICICATDANTAAALIPSLPTALSHYLGQTLEYTACLSVNFVLSKRPDNPVFVYQIARSEHPYLTTLVLEHNKVDDRAPPGKGLLCALFGHEYSQVNMQAADEDIIAQALTVVEKYLPESRPYIEATHVNRWPKVVVKSAPGSYAGIQPLLHYRESARHIHLVGDYYSLSGMNTALTSAEQCVKTILQRFPSASHSVV